MRAKKMIQAAVMMALLMPLSATLGNDAGPYPYDEDRPRGVVGDAPTGWGDSCWQGPAAGKSNYHVWYTEVTAGGAVDLEDLFGAGHGLTIADLAYISFYTKKAAGIPADRDWWMTIYTIETGSDDSGSWYKSRLHARPDVGPGYSPSFAYDAWNLWSTDGAASSTNQLVFYDSVRTPSTYETLAELKDGTGRDYSAEQIKSITLQTDSGWDGFDGLIDGLRIELTDARVGDVNMVAGPTQVWVDDDYCDTCANDGHLWGYDAFDSIQDGIDAVTAGGTTHVAAGTYQENLAGWKDMEIIKSLSLIGAGSGSTVVELTEGKTNGVEIRGSGLDVTIEGITFTRASASTYASGFNLRVGETTSTFTSLVLRDVESAYASGRNVFIDGKGAYQSISVDNCSFHHSGAWGFSVRGTVQGLTVVDSDFEYNGTSDAAHGIGFDIDMPISIQNVSVSGGSFSHNQSKGINLVKTVNAAFSGITASNNGGAPGGGFGVSLWEWVSASSGLSFAGCTFNNNSTDGFLFGTQGTTTIDDVTIECCTIQGNGRDGVLLYHNYGGSANNVQIVNSTITGNSSKGVEVSGMTNVVDAANNWWGTIDGAAIAGMVGGTVDYDPWLAGPPPCGDNVLWLNVEDTSLYVKPSESVVIDMDAMDLLQPVTGVQAVLNFSSTYFSTGSGDVSVVPGDGPWTELIYNVWTVDGDLDVAVGVDLGTPGGTDADATTAVITLKPTGTEGVTQMVFRPDVNEIDATFFSDTSHQAVWPTKIESQLIVIDGTDPVVANLAATQGGTDVLDCAATTVQGTVDISVDASDALARLEAEPAVTVTKGTDSLAVTYVDESPSGTFNYTVTIAASTPNGTWNIDVTATDKAGNSAGVSGTLCVNKNQVGGTVSMDTFSAGPYGFSRDVVFKATDGSGTVLKTWTQTVSFVNNTGTKVASGPYTLTDVPAATVNLSAKTAWSLRQRQAVTMDGNGQATNDFVLAGGDLNGTNAVNILDYSILKENWNTTNAVADINGDGLVQTLDYSLLKDNWFTGGDPE